MTPAGLSPVAVFVVGAVVGALGMFVVLLPAVLRRPEPPNRAARRRKDTAPVVVLRGRR